MGVNVTDSVAARTDKETDDAQRIDARRINRAADVRSSINIGIESSESDQTIAS
jgi:hypothetical protein